MRLFAFLSIVLFILNLSADWSHWKKYKRTYYSIQVKMWPELNPKQLVASQIWQESLWNPRAALKTSREYGFGLGQMTKAWTKSGRIRFDKFKEAKKKYKELKYWGWEDRWNVEKQLIFIFKEDLMLYKKFSGYTNDPITRYALMLSA